MDGRMIRVIESRHEVSAEARILDLQVHRDADTVVATLQPMEPLFAGKTDLVERLFLYAVDLCNHHSIAYLCITDPHGLFPPEGRPDFDTPKPTARRPENPELRDLRSASLGPEALVRFGFRHAGFWQAKSDRAGLQLKGSADGKPAVYAFV